MTSGRRSNGGEEWEAEGQTQKSAFVSAAVLARAFEAVLGGGRSQIDCLKTARASEGGRRKGSSGVLERGKGDQRCL